MSTDHVANYACYRRGCRRTECRTADRIYRKRYELRRLAGVPSHIPGPVVAAHLRTLIDSGHTIRAIAKQADVSERAINYILNGQANVLRAKALALLAVQPLTQSPRVDPTGTARRIQALAAIGWPISWTAAQTGYHYSYLFTIIAGRTETIPRPVAHRFTALYREYSQRAGYSEHARSIARRNNWHGPLAWDDINDPDCQPETEGRTDVHRRHKATVDPQRVARLTLLGKTNQQIADELGCHERTVSRVRRRAEQQLAA